VVIYDWTMAPIPRPLCYHAEPCGAGKGILVEEELARAVRQESAMAIAHWWGICRATVRKWRQTFSVGRMDAEGSRRLIHNASLGGLNARRKYAPQAVRLWTDEEIECLRALPDAMR
jgi:transposase-like protein